MTKSKGRRLLVISTAALFLTSIAPMDAVRAQSSTTMSTADANLNAPRYVERMGSMNIYLMNSSKMALDRSQNPAVRGFAQRLIERHSQMQYDLAAVNNSNVGGSMPSVMNGEDTQLMGTLAGSDMPSFNINYMRNAIFILDRELAIAKVQAANGKVDSLRKLAAAAVPKIDDNLREAKTIAGTAGI